MKREGNMGENEISMVCDKIESGFGKANNKIGRQMLKSFSEIN